MENSRILEMAKNLSTLAPVAEKWRENSPIKEIPIPSTKNSRCMDCILPIFNSFISLQNSDINSNQILEKQRTNQQQKQSTIINSHPTSSNKFIIPTLYGSPVCLKDDQDFLFGYTIASMLKTFPRAERNRIKVHIFSFLAVTQNQISCNEREYFV